ncbi:flagellar filament capping protein FliD [Vibrio marisflavi]|uniref:Flagellar hook-associated protein 2 C-terminal domain-containing protein n=1 Tax=Vibrio marisflavi CECT 7928 TaxID=634439 RepID=A0ABM9A6C2_9VIBR|nr:flagellar filament capping protein FliD [Vibrio marisflavi]CAH0540043.1 hypothetical protein VMF7928_02587 [Vibrio marisflavi CECT 7928]
MSGVGSAVSINGITLNQSFAQSIATAEYQSQLKNLQTEDYNTQTDISAYSKIVAAMKAAEAALAKITSNDTNKVTSSSSAITADISSGATSAFTSSMTIGVSQLASSQEDISSGWSSTTQTSSSSTITVDVNGTKTSIKVAAKSSMQDIAKDINAAGAGVKASVMTVSGGQQKLIIQGDNIGKSASFTVSATGDSSVTSLMSNLTTAQTAQDAIVTIGSGSNAKPQSFSSNKITVSGVTLTLNSTTASNAPATISGTVSTSTLEANIQSFVSAYNTLMTTYAPYVKSGTATSSSDSSSSTSAGPLSDDQTALSAHKQLTGLLDQVTSDRDFELSNLGLSLSGDQMSFDSSQFTKTMNSTQSANYSGPTVADYSKTLSTLVGNLSTILKESTDTTSKTGIQAQVTVLNQQDSSYQTQIYKVKSDMVTTAQTLYNGFQQANNVIASMQSAQTLMKALFLSSSSDSSS